jgi:hypothetical protein
MADIVRRLDESPADIVIADDAGSNGILDSFAKPKRRHTGIRHGITTSATTGARDELGANPLARVCCWRLHDAVGRAK